MNATVLNHTGPAQGLPRMEGRPRIIPGRGGLPSPQPATQGRSGMFNRKRLAILAAVVASVLVVPATASADHATRPHTDNMHAKGESPHPATFLGEPDGVRHISSDIAFQGRLAFNGNYDGFRIIDISDPDNPQEI